MELGEYQRTASQTSKLAITNAEKALPPLLGLASEIGSLLDVYKRYLRDGTDLNASRAFFKEELGDLLWYTAAVATSCGLDLDEIAADNLEKTQSLYPTRGAENSLEVLPVLDQQYPMAERFPRRMFFEFRDANDTPPVTTIRLMSAEPNAFPNGPIGVDGKERGYEIGGQVGDPLTDNARRSDDYRFHDAIHLGFAAVLGWSPTLRSLLRIKRKSDKATDNAEDGARAAFAEEGLAAVLAHLAHRRNEFTQEVHVDSSTLMVVQAATAGLEVEQLPLWLWRRAITQGFTVMRELAKHGGGRVKADLDTKTLVFEPIDAATE
jgi:NTP pyrophosphatase (non-canonical NTP hydrolase)